MEAAGTLALPGSFALSDPPHCLSAVLSLRLDAVSAFRELQRAVDVQRKAVLGLFWGSAILRELGRQFLHTASTMASCAFSLRRGLWEVNGRASHFQSQASVLETCYALCQCPLCSQEALAALLLHQGSQLTD